MTIYIDDRTGSKELDPLIPTGIPHKLTRLDYADMSFLGKGADGLPLSIGVERKTIGDLVSSINDGRLSGHQLHGLLSSYNVIYILVEGLWRPCPVTGVLEHFRRGKWQPLSYRGSKTVMARYVNNYLNTLVVMCGVHVWQTGTIKQSAQWLVDTYSWWGKDWDKHKAHKQYQTATMACGKRAIDNRRGGAVEFSKPGLVQRVAKEFKGVGFDRSQAVADHFGSVFEFVLADKKDLMKVEGIGKGLAGSIDREKMGG